MREENEGGGGDATRLARRVRNRKGRARAHGVTELMTGGGRRPCTRRNKALTARCGRSSWRSWSEFGADQKRESTRAQRTQDGLGTLPSSSSIRRREGSLERGKLTQRSGQLVRPSPRSKVIEGAKLPTRGVNGNRSKFFLKFKPSAYIPKITQALKRSSQSLE